METYNINGNRDVKQSSDKPIEEFHAKGRYLITSREINVVYSTDSLPKAISFVKQNEFQDYSTSPFVMKLEIFDTVDNISIPVPSNEALHECVVHYNGYYNKKLHKFNKGESVTQIIPSSGLEVWKESHKEYLKLVVDGVEIE